MTEKVLQTLKYFNMLSEGERVLVGLSGGADSVALSLCLKELGAAVVCLHVNHCLRGDESDGDERFCREFCKRHGFELKVCRVDVVAYCREHKTSSELGARTLRYECFEKTADELGIDKIATAHTLTDCFETTLINLVRGCGIKGVCGIPPVRERYIRPLIECTREEIETFVKEHGERFVTDSTNMIPDCTRNIIRLNVVPKLLELNGGLYKSYKTTVRNLRGTLALTEKLCRESINSAKASDTSYYTDKLLGADQSIAGAALSEIMKAHCGESSADRIADVMKICRENGKITLSGGVIAEVRNGILSFNKSEEPIEDIEIPIDIGQSVCAFGKRLSIMTAEGNKINKKFTNNEMDYDKIRGDIFVRNRRCGDRIRLCGKGFTSSVKTLFNAEVEPRERAKRLFVCDDDGIVFIEGFGCADRVRCTANTEKTIEIFIEKA